jgi:hypothetical protein
MKICGLGLRDLASDRQLDICLFTMYQPCHSGNLLLTRLAVVSIKLLASANILDFLGTDMRVEVGRVVP